MTEPITLPAPIIDQPNVASTKWQCEYQVFQRLLPQLLTTHRGQYVAIHEGQVVERGDNKLSLALRVLAKIGNVAIHVGLVTNGPQPVAHSGLRWEMGRCGGAA